MATKAFVLPIVDALLDSPHAAIPPNDLRADSEAAKRYAPRRACSFPRRSDSPADATSTG